MQSCTRTRRQHHCCAATASARRTPKDLTSAASGMRQGSAKSALFQHASCRETWPAGADFFVGGWAHPAVWPRSLTCAFAGGALFHGRHCAATGADAGGAAGMVEFLNSWILSTTVHVVLDLATSQSCAISPFLRIFLASFCWSWSFGQHLPSGVGARPQNIAAQLSVAQRQKRNVAVSTRVWCSEKVKKIWRLYIPTPRNLGKWKVVVGRWDGGLKGSDWNYVCSSRFKMQLVIVWFASIDFCVT